MSMMRYTGQRLRATGMRTLDATFARAGSAMLALARSGFSLIAGRELRGWAIGVDGYTARMLDGQPSEIMLLTATNEVIYACLRARMKALIQPTFVIERKQPDGSYVAEPDHPLAGLLRRPGPNLDTASFWRCLEASYSSLGRLYLEPIYSKRRRVLAGFNPLNPAYVTEQYDGDGILISYDWAPPDARKISFAPEELITRRAVDWADVPPLIAALGAAEADRLANEFIAGFFGGGGIPSGIIKGRGTWDQTRADDFRAAWMRRFTAGSRAPAILDENIESYERIGVSLDEIGDDTLMMYIETRLCMCYEVPPLIVYAYAGLLKATYSNLQEAWASFWDATALPLQADWAGWITWALLILFESEDDIRLANVRCRFDVSQIGPYQEDLTAKNKQYGEGFDKDAVTLNEYRGTMGLEPRTGGDQLEREKPQPEVEPAAADDPDEDPGEEEEKAGVLELPARIEVLND